MGVMIGEQKGHSGGTRGGRDKGGVWSGKAIYNFAKSATLD